MVKPGKLGSLELGRFLAALMITVSHEINMLRIEPGLHGAHFLGGFDLPQPPAVDYFFVLSGFVMVTAHGHELGQPGATLRFFWRRICRIYPVYWLVLCVPLFLYWPVTSAAQLLQLVTLSPTQTPEYVGTAWTLRYEVAFYLVFGLVLLPRVGRIVLWLWVGGTLLAWLPAMLHVFDHTVFTTWRDFVVKNPAPTHFFFYIFDVLFMGGIAAGYCFSRNRCHWELAAALARWGVLILVIALFHSGWGFLYGSTANFLLFTLGFSLLMLGIAELERHDVVRFGGWAGVLGQLSYPLYVVHPVIELIVNRWLLRWPSQPSAFVVFTFLLVATAAVTLAVTFLFDQPVQRLRQRRQ